MTYLKKKKNVKFRKKFNTRVIRSHHPYSVEEIADLLHVHENTVCAWIKEGLLKIDEQQPFLIHGSDLIDFLKARNKSKKRPCELDQLYCCKCQEPRRSNGNVVVIKINNCRTNVVGKCELCGTKIYKTISPQKVDFFKTVFTVEAVYEENLVECANTPATVSKKRGARK